MGDRYGVQTIPTQVIYDADGNEVFRHIGFWPKEDIDAKLKELGVVD
ncbi:MAG: TlpA family protein disulfide reductase [Armatimonadota bacterium]